MESTNLLAVGALLLVAVVVVILLLRFMRARHPGPELKLPQRASAPPAAGPAAQKLSDDDAEYLDSSHIISPTATGHDPAHPDAAARAAAALRDARRK